MGVLFLRPKLKAAASHGLMSYLFSLGMALTLLGVTGLLVHGWTAALLLAVLNAVMVLSGLNRRFALGASCVTLFAGLLWLVLGGASLLGEVMQALVWHTSGLTTALPMVGMPFTVIICALCTGVSWFVTQRSAGAIPALILLVMAAVLLWLGGWPEVLACLLPAVLACVTLLLRAGDEHTSTLRVLPLAAMVTGIAFTGVAVGGAVLDPLKELADSIRQRIYDTLFYTQPRDVFTLATEGYYPQGMSQLGGPATPREDPVMAVITPRKTYLRGVLKNVYTGRMWQDGIGGRRYLWSAPRFEEMRRAAFDMDLPALDGSVDASLLSSRMLQVRMLRESASTLFVPQRVRTLSPEGELIPYFNGSSEIFATSNLTVGDVWTMEAALFSSTDADVQRLVNAASFTPDDNWKQVCDDYLQLHDEIDQRVYNLATEITAGEPTAYAKALALQNYLAANYVYTLDVAEQPVHQDFVSTFLIETKAGYCTYFASALTVMCRMAGLPARYVEGYVAYPDAEGLAIVTGKEGHAWTEVYFSGFGWVTFDATPLSVDYVEVPPSVSNSGNEDQQETPTPEPSDAPTPTPPPDEQPTPEASSEQQSQQTPTPAPQEQQADEPQSKGAAMTIIGRMLLFLLLALLVLRTLLVQPAVQAMRKKTDFGRWLVWAQATHDALRRHRLIRGKAETPAAFFGRVAQSGKVAVSLQELATAENLMFYGHAAPLAEEIVMARDSFRAVYRTLNIGQKLLFQLKRICLSARRTDFTQL